MPGNLFSDLQPVYLMWKSAWHQPYFIWPRSRSKCLITILAPQILKYLKEKLFSIPDSCSQFQDDLFTAKHWGKIHKGLNGTAFWIIVLIFVMVFLKEILSWLLFEALLKMRLWKICSGNFRIWKIHRKIVSLFEEEKWWWPYQWHFSRLVY